MNLRTLLRISRPRFWLYLAGTYLIGVASSAKFLPDIVNPVVLALFLFFLIPANVFLYGINDLADGDTDKFNTKKGKKEHLLRERERAALVAWVWVCAFLALGVAAWFAFTGSWLPSVLVLVFLALGAAYSVLPLRLKARPFWDSASNVLYIVPGLVGYAQLTGRLPSLLYIGAFACWTAAMHLFSAIPDIAADRKAKLRTSATVLGQRNALLVCAALWTVLAVTLVTVHPFFAPTFVYVIAPLLLLQSDAKRIERVYWWFPWITGVLGFLSFWLLVLARVPLIT